MANIPVDCLQSVTATLNGRPILEMASRIVIAEDMGSTFPRSTIFVGRDSRFEMQEALAGQQLSISIQPSSGPALTVSHVVHSAKPSTHPGGKGLTGVINGVSPDYPSSLQKRTKKSWKAKNADSIIKETHSEFSKYPIEVSSGMKQTSMNGMSQMPLQTIDKAGGLSGTGSRGFYYQTQENGGKAHFKTMKDLTSKGPKASFRYNAAASADESSVSDTTAIYDLHYEGSSISNAKQTEVQGQSYNPSFNKTGKNDKAGQGSTTPGLGLQGGASTTSYPVINTVEQDKEKRLVDRDKQNLNDYSSKLRLLTMLRSDLHVGDVIYVNSGSATYFSDSAPENSATGKWLITAILHSVELGGGDTATHIGRSLINCIGKI